MAENTHIEWTNHSLNFFLGCRKVSKECGRCYLYRIFENKGKDASKLVEVKSAFTQPYKWKEPALVFTNSMSDFFWDEADHLRPRAWEVIQNTPHLQYQILTKRPERIKDHLPFDWGDDGYPNVWLGVSAGTEEQTFIQLSELLKTSAVVRFWSAEPLLEDVCSSRNIELIRQLDWVIIGGESGYKNGKFKARPMEPDWAEKLINVCKKYNVPCFMKQVGSVLAFKHKFRDWHGGDMVEWPERFKVREYPHYYYDYKEVAPSKPAPMPKPSLVELVPAPVQLKLL